MADERLAVSAHMNVILGGHWTSFYCQGRERSAGGGGEGGCPKGVYRRSDNRPFGRRRKGRRLYYSSRGQKNELVDKL